MSTAWTANQSSVRAPCELIATALALFGVIGK